MSLLKTLSSLTQRFGLANTLGGTFNGNRDLYNVFGYPTNITYDMYYAKYERQDVAKRVIDAPAAATWVRGVEIEASEAFKAAWEKLMQTTKIYNAFERVDRLAGIGKYAILFIGFNDKRQPNRPVGKATEILFIQPYSEKAIEIKEVEVDPTNPRFGLPKLYKITTASPSDLKQDNLRNTSTTGKKVEVHWSRVLHVAENALENELIGIPRLKPIYNRLLDLEKVVGGSAETFWLTGNRGLHVDIDKEMELTDDDAQDLSDEMDEYMHELRRVIRTKGVNVKSLGSDVVSPMDNFKVLIALISGASGIPQRILLGSEAGQLASEQDRANWAERIDERRVDFGEAYILYPFVALLQKVEMLPDEFIRFLWPNAFILNPLEQAQMMAQRARAVVNMSRRVQMGNPLITDTEARDWMDLPETTSEDLVSNTLGMDTKVKKDDADADKASNEAEVAAETDEEAESVENLTDEDDKKKEAQADKE